jgi:hypothetical protein
MRTFPTVTGRRLGTTLYFTGAELALIGVARHFGPAPRRLATRRSDSRAIRSLIKAAIPRGTLRPPGGTSK